MGSVSQDGSYVPPHARNQGGNQRGGRDFGSDRSMNHRGHQQRGREFDQNRNGDPRGNNQNRGRDFNKGPDRYDNRSRQNNDRNDQRRYNESGPCNHDLPPGNRNWGSQGHGHWDTNDGHIIADEDPKIESTLFGGNHVSSGINFSKYDDIPVDATGEDVPSPINGFTDANLDPLLLENIHRAAYTIPTPVQKFSIAIVNHQRDLMSCAQTGSGKTAGFLFPILDSLFKNGPQYTLNPCQNAYKTRASAHPIALILAPTRELVSQIHDEAKRFTYRSWVRSVAVYGGVLLRNQITDIHNGSTIIVATPGRLNDLLDKEIIKLNHVRYFVLDEADRMLDMGFEPQIREIVSKFDLPKAGNRCTLMFSATFPKGIQKLAGEFLNKYIFLSVGRVGSASENVEQKVLQVDEGDKKDCLLDILHGSEKDAKVLVFVETKRLAADLADFLCRQKFPAASIHGDRPQNEREQALDSFRSGKTPVLVATAVAARGLDIPNVAHVINYDLPGDIDDYVHRIGRTGRAGNMGQSTAFFTYEKNGGIADDLKNILVEAKQKVPEFLENASNRPNNFRNSRNGGGGNNNGGGGNNRRTQNRDFRRDNDNSNNRYQNDNRHQNDNFNYNRNQNRDNW